MTKEAQGISEKLWTTRFESFTIDALSFGSGLGVPFIGNLNGAELLQRQLT